eukprot:15364816-Ditylum_brightwellii.AAC.1
MAIASVVTITAAYSPTTLTATAFSAILSGAGGGLEAELAIRNGLHCLYKVGCDNSTEGGFLLTKLLKGCQLASQDHLWWRV